MNTAIDDIAAERQRQIEGEGWTPEHDDTHTEGEMAIAAACYANPIKIIVSGDGFQVEKIGDVELPLGWPEAWDYNWWKPTNRRRDLVKAAALILAEIERLDRLSPKENSDE